MKHKPYQNFWIICKTHYQNQQMGIDLNQYFRNIPLLILIILQEFIDHSEII